MNASKRRIVVGLAVFLPLMAVVAVAQPAQIYYRFAPPLPTVTCTTYDGQPAAVTTGISVEWSNIPTGSSINAFKLVNGVTTLQGNYPIIAGTGSQLFAGLTAPGPSFPLSVGLRYDTLANGVDVYQSTLLLTCPAIGVAGTAEIINLGPEIPTLSYWGLVVMAAVLGLIGLAALRRLL